MCSTKSYPLLNQCFYIQTCGTAVCTEACPDGTFYYLLTFNGVSVPTDTYSTAYSTIGTTAPPVTVPGVANKVTDLTYNAVFDDGSVMDLTFSDSSLTLGRASITTPTLVGEYCLISTSLYAQFYG
ncbi:hypothetical protein EBZ80_04970 [bacterium]|nr:hypothetical protein [bacterium]